MSQAKPMTFEEISNYLWQSIRTPAAIRRFVFERDAPDRAQEEQGG